mmetsp:Transcript_30479/g.68364  ORF Transcript_30479/g.68364 Transcript_30479/m.68364 type:complete len:766 (+) Transcript_30479:125-2422(+)
MSSSNSQVTRENLVRRRPGSVATSQATHLTDETGILPLWIKTLFAVPRFTIRASYIVQSAYVTYFYESIGARLTYIAAYVAIARSFDVITDPLMGWVSDNTHSRLGRRKPYMGLGAIFYNACLLLLLMPPRTMDHPALSHWFGLTYTAFFLFDTFTSIPYYAFGMEMTNKSEERDQVWFWNQLSGNLGTLVGMALPAILTYAVTGNLYTVFAFTAAVFALVHFAGMYGNILLIAEKPTEETSYKVAAAAAAAKSNKAGKRAGPLSSQATGGVLPGGLGQSAVENANAEPWPSPFVVNLLRCMRNKAFDTIIKSYFLDYLGLGMISAMTPFYVGYVLLRPEGGNADDTDVTVVTIGMMAVFLFVAALVSVPVWERIAASVGKYKAWIWYSVWNAVTCPFFALCGTNRAAAFFVAFLNGSALGGQFLLDSIVNDVVEYDTMLHGDSIEGSFVAIQTFVPKIVLVAAMSLPFAIIAACGFEASRCVDPGWEAGEACDQRAPEPQTQVVRNLIVSFFCLVPTAATLVSIFYKLQYPIKTAELSKLISEAREAHSRGEAAVDPLTGRSVGPLCLCRVKDERRRRALMAIAHFPETTVRKLKHRENPEGGLPDFMAAPIRQRSYAAALIFVGCVSTAAMTFSWLENDADAWVPIIACVSVGAVLVFVYVFYEVKSQLPLLGTLVTPLDVALYLGKLDGKTPDDDQANLAFSSSSSVEEGGQKTKGSELAKKNPLGVKPTNGGAATRAESDSGLDAPPPAPAPLFAGPTFTW